MHNFQDPGSELRRRMITTVMSHMGYSIRVEVALVLNDDLGQETNGCLPYSLMATRCGATKYMWYKGL